MRTTTIFAQTHTSERTMSPTGLFGRLVAHYWVQLMPSRLLFCSYLNHDTVRLVLLAIAVNDDQHMLHAAYDTNIAYTACVRPYVRPPELCEHNISTRKLCYRKDDRAMRPTHECPENFRDFLTTPMATIPNIFMGFSFESFDRPYECSNKIWSP